MSKIRAPAHLPVISLITGKNNFSAGRGQGRDRVRFNGRVNGKGFVRGGRFNERGFGRSGIFNGI